jgi:hypothetical protein
VFGHARELAVKRIFTGPEWANRTATGLEPAWYRPGTASEPCRIFGGIQAWKYQPPEKLPKAYSGANAKR